MKVFLIILIYLNAAFGLKILGVLHHSMKSHYTIGRSILGSLLDAGHNVTALTYHKTGENVENYQVVQIPDIMEVLQVPNKSPLDFVNIPIILAPLMFPYLSLIMVKTIMNSTNLEEFLMKDEQYDVCIMELFMSEALLGIAEKVKCSVIQYTTFDAFLWSDRVLGHDSSPSYVPNSFLRYNDKMTFWQRLWNTFFTLLDKSSHILCLNIQNWLYKKYFPNAERSFDEMYKNTSLIFINNHVSSSLVRSMMPTQIEIGGIHVKPAKPLPDDLQKFMDEATDGVILFSMGSYIDGIDWELEQREAFLKVFGKLKQKVIWKYSNETLPGNPGNIKIGSWFPQRDILAHPNLKLFITHGGLLGTTEAIAEGIPVLGIPIFGDQMMNMAKTVDRGYGLQVLFNDISEETLSNALNQLLKNPAFKNNALEVSKRFNDRPTTPQQDVVYWTEYVARHHGAAHLQAKSVDLNFIEYYLIDVYCILLSVTFLLLYVQIMIIKFVMRKLIAKFKLNKKKYQ